MDLKVIQRYYKTIIRKQPKLSSFIALRYVKLNSEILEWAVKNTDNAMDLLYNPYMNYNYFNYTLNNIDHTLYQNFKWDKYTLYPEMFHNNMSLSNKIINDIVKNNTLTFHMLSKLKISFHKIDKDSLSLNINLNTGEHILKIDINNNFTDIKFILKSLYQ